MAQPTDESLDRLEATLSMRKRDQTLAARHRLDAIYRHQRQFYDVTRRFFLLGRDRLIRELGVARGGLVLELGCGTGRNLIVAARRYPTARCFGIDLSGEMLKTAQASIERHALVERISLGYGDATGFDPVMLFGVRAFDRVFVSYSLSMIPQWESVIEAALGVLAEGGSLHIVDFGQQQQLPAWFGRALHAWLGLFGVNPVQGLEKALAAAAQKHGAKLRFHSILRDYAVIGTISFG